MIFEKPCDVCGKPFMARSDRDKMCSDECRIKARRDYQKKYIIARKAIDPAFRQKMNESAKRSNRKRYQEDLEFRVRRKNAAKKRYEKTHGRVTPEICIECKSRQAPRKSYVCPECRESIMTSLSSGKITKDSAATRLHLTPRSLKIILYRWRKKNDSQ